VKKLIQQIKAAGHFFAENDSVDEVIIETSGFDWLEGSRVCLEAEGNGFTIYVMVNGGLDYKLTERLRKEYKGYKILEELHKGLRTWIKQPQSFLGEIYTIYPICKDELEFENAQVITLQRAKFLANQPQCQNQDAVLWLIERVDQVEEL